MMIREIHEQAELMFKEGEEVFKEGAKAVALGMILYEKAKKEEANYYGGHM